MVNFMNSIDTSQLFMPILVENIDTLYLNNTNSYSRKLAVQKKSYLYNNKYQKCRDSGEAYSAAYLIHKEHLLHQFTDYNLSWVNCEMGSFIMMNGKADPKKNINGSVLQSIDVLDFSVIHLSAYERLQRRWDKSIGVKKMKTGNIDPIVGAVDLLKERAMILRDPNTPSIFAEFNTTVVIMPFLYSDMGAGHSKISNRLHYLRACFWSFYAYYPHIVAAVKTKKEQDFVRNETDLPFFDVMLIPNLPKSASLPVATVQQTKLKISSGKWPFDYVFFTESDQLLMLRSPSYVYDYLKKYPRHLMIPHRLMAYPEPVLTIFHKRSLNDYNPFDWFDFQCCMPLQNCVERNYWVHVKNSSVPIINIYGIQVPLGNSNFHTETFRACRLHEDDGHENVCIAKNAM
eukprot:gene10863-14580_t